jgi:hypothetical protein
MSNPKEEQLAIVERLQLKWLKRMEQLLDNDEITSTDMATLARLLMTNGWNLDPSAIPQGLKDKLTTAGLSFDETPMSEELYGAEA